MIDWLSSKVAVTVAGFAILAGSLGLLAITQQGYETAAMQQVAGEVTHAIGQLSSLSVETNLTFSFTEQPGVWLPKAIRGVSYSLEFRQNIVLVRRAGILTSAKFAEGVHLWNPGNTRDATFEQVALADRVVASFTILSGLDFQAVRRYVGGLGYLTFIYHPQTETLQQYLDEDLVPGMDRGETSPGTTTVSIPDDYDAMLYPGMVAIRTKTVSSGDLWVRAFTKVDHLWQPSGDQYSGEDLDVMDFENAGPLYDVRSFTVEWVFVQRLDQPCPLCESGYRTTPEGFAYP